MNQNFKKYLDPKKYVTYMRRKLAKPWKRSYSQLGEDLVIIFIFSILKISNPTYLDIGTNDPKKLNNTYKLYSKGWKGVCIEPDPVLCKKIRKVRPNDMVLNVGVGISEEKSVNFYLMDDHRLNTFSEHEAARMKTMGHTIQKMISIPLIPIHKIIKDNFATYPNFVSIDTEGMDLDIIKTFDFTTSLPEVFCIETVIYKKGGLGKKIPEIRELMERNGYFAFTDTYINTIFVNKKAWESRGHSTF